jgi:hypothetical protein
MHSSDIELSNKELQPVGGFPRVAAKIASDVDKTTTIYRRFDRLSARNILLLQAELAELERLQDRYDAEDRKRIDGVVVDGRHDWREFVKNAAETDISGKLLYPQEKEKMDLAIRIREKLKEYCKWLSKISTHPPPSTRAIAPTYRTLDETITLHKGLLNTTPPSSNTVKAMRNWFFDNTTGTKGGGEVPQLWGASEQTYDDIHDLVALRVPADQDRLSKFIQNNFGLFFQTTTPDNRTTYISERSISNFVAILSTILASVLLFGAIISLYIVQNKHALLGMLSGWTVLFAACVGLLTNARRDQIFGATAAYAAVLVVFISGNLGGSPSNVGSCVCTPG